MAASGAAASLPVAEAARCADARPSALRSEKSGDVTPETVTPPTRSVSPSSDGGALLSPRDGRLGAAGACQEAAGAGPAARQGAAGGGRREAPGGGQQAGGSTPAPQESAASSGRGGSNQGSSPRPRAIAVVWPMSKLRSLRLLASARCLEEVTSRTRTPRRTGG
ncbi:unnamed protein product [Prorocentrum cordatum]|uniref:Uncharacterized protein n=1 Tax=Prorocentrum cordatum TaxID=2364126 RepID=A0ABN9PKF3_9DINO|nr:unnamed protein product [Polarella glacialis]